MRFFPHLDFYPLTLINKSPTKDCSQNRDVSPEKDPIVYIRVIDAIDGTPRPEIKVQYSCADCSNRVEHDESTNGNGILDIGLFKDQIPLAFYAYDQSSQTDTTFLGIGQIIIERYYQSEVTLVTPNKNETDSDGIYHVTLKISCKVGYYGANCESECSDNCFTQNIDSCYEDRSVLPAVVTCDCKHGYYEANCSSLCVSGCSETGTSSCDDTTCLCKPGYYGTLCNETCVDRCNVTGIDSCDASNCNCKTGYDGNDCGDCADGYYPTGDDDSVICSACECNTEGTENGGNTCDDDGKCTCESGITGDKCNSCEIGSYTFPDCAHNCTACNTANIKNCDEDNGAVICHCKPGFYGTTCSEMCSDCVTENIDNCGLDLADESTVRCICKTGYFGTNCENECDQCNSDNTQYCIGSDKATLSNCDCQPGYDYNSYCAVDVCPQCNKDGIESCTADSCGGACKLGYYGTYCENQCTQCNTNLLDGLESCDATSCTCKSGFTIESGCRKCQEGYYKKADYDRELCCALYGSNLELIDTALDSSNNYIGNSILSQCRPTCSEYPTTALDSCGFYLGTTGTDGTDSQVRITVKHLR